MQKTAAATVDYELAEQQSILRCHTPHPVRAASIMPKESPPPTI
jgi:hypothetical protein